MPRIRAPKPRAFTLVEVTVAVGILSILAGLALPAIQNSRSAARRMQCASSLRQLDLALTMYHDSTRSLPPGTYSEESKRPFQGWYGELLPFLEQNAVATEIDHSFRQGRSPFGESHIHFATAIAAFACPEDSRTFHANKAVYHNRMVGTTSYLGVNGKNHLLKDGVLFYDSKIRFRDITDGLSNTLLSGERPPDRDFSYGWWYAGVGSGDGTLDHTIGVHEIESNRYRFCYELPSKFQASNLWAPCSTSHFWSMHPNGAHFGMADGSVVFLSYAVDSAVLEAMASRSGSETLLIP